jgi:hypothetical protein
VAHRLSNTREGPSRHLTRKGLHPDGRQEFIEVKGMHIWEDNLMDWKTKELPARVLK